MPASDRIPCAPRVEPRAGVAARLSRSRVAVGALLMDQAVLAGVGNVYRAEVLFRARMSPFRLGRDVTRRGIRRRCGPIWCCLMKAGVREGRIITTAPKDRPRGPAAQPSVAGGGELRLPAHRTSRAAFAAPRSGPLNGRPQPVLVPALPAGLNRPPGWSSRLPDVARYESHPRHRPAQPSAAPARSTSTSTASAPQHIIYHRRRARSGFAPLSTARRSSTRAAPRCCTRATSPASGTSRRRHALRSLDRHRHLHPLPVQGRR